uniref:Uncharacterized protein n=1 Tax=Anguilla anguilla TaxID=7936 RepID=A0A0E9V408_ANGAN
MAFASILSCWYRPKILKSGPKVGSSFGSLLPDSQ